MLDAEDILEELGFQIVAALFDADVDIVERAAGPACCCASTVPVSRSVARRPAATVSRAKLIASRNSSWRVSFRFA